MFELLYALPLVELALAILATLLLIAAAVDRLLSLLQPTAVGKAALGLTNNTYQLIATLTALVMAFLASSVWSDGHDARSAVRAEARALRQAVELASGLPAPARDDFHAAARDYVQVVVTQEWPAMAEGHSHTFAYSQRLRLVAIIARMEARNEHESSLTRWIMGALEQMEDARAKRLDLAHNAITPVKWLVVLLLAAVTMASVGFCHIDKPGARRIALSLYAVAASAMMFLIYSHDRPFTGEIVVDPGPLIRAIQQEPAPDTAPHRMSGLTPGR